MNARSLATTRKSLPAWRYRTPAPVTATALAAGLLLALLEILELHHAPAAATVILVASSLVPVGRPLAGLAVALVAVIALSAALAKAWPAPAGTERAA